MKELQLFSNPQFGEVRTIEIKGKTYFAGFDIAKALGYVKPHNAINQHCKRITKRGVVCKSGSYIDGNGVKQQAEQIVNMLFIPEGDIYRLVANSQLPGAAVFESWIFDEVLPTIHYTGGYIHTSQEDTPELIMARALQIAQTTIDNHNQHIQILQGENEHLTNEVKVLSPKATYTDEVLQSTSTYTMTQLAKELDMTEPKLKKYLKANKIVYDQSGQWMLHAKYTGKGYAKSRTHK